MIYITFYLILLIVILSLLIISLANQSLTEFTILNNAITYLTSFTVIYKKLNQRHYVPNSLVIL